jgi:hypothetical protein
VDRGTGRGMQQSSTDLIRPDLTRPGLPIAWHGMREPDYD